MLGLVTARTISKGRYGRSKQINSCIPNNVDAEAIMVESEPEMEEVFLRPYRHQSRL
jgi:Cdc6-like AAA superfamily ATPase